MGSGGIIPSHATEDFCLGAEVRAASLGARDGRRLRLRDSVFFSRIDLSQTQALFALYAAVCFVSIPALHWLEMRGERRGAALPVWRFALSLSTQFALGGFWSAFVIFYGRSAVLGASWPFMILVFLVFTSVLFFFALYSYMTFEAPVFTGSIGTRTFLLSGLVAVLLLALFTVLLRMVARERGDLRRPPHCAPAIRRRGGRDAPANGDGYVEIISPPSRAVSSVSLYRGAGG